MSRIRKIAAGIAALWMVAVLVLGIGGSWVSRNPEVLAEGSLTVAGIDGPRMEAQQRAAEQQRQQKIEALKYKGDGWGEDAASGQPSASVSDWGE